MRSYIFTDTDFEENNPSVSCADSSLYTREPWFAVSRKLKQCIVKALIIDIVFRYNEVIEKNCVNRKSVCVTASCTECAIMAANISALSEQTKDY